MLTSCRHLSDSLSGKSDSFKSRTRSRSGLTRYTLPDLPGTSGQHSATEPGGKGPRCARAAGAFSSFLPAVLRIVRARSTGATVLRTAAQRMPCVGASLISSHNPSAACPSGCPGSVGHSYAKLRQQAKNMVGEMEAGTFGARPARAKRSITS